MRFGLAASLVCLIFMLGYGWSQRTDKSVLDVRLLMSAADFQKAGLNKLNEDELSNLNAWLSGYSLRLLTNGGSSGGTGSFEKLEGAVIVADDGQFLGKITINSIGHNSVLNSIGPYGSQISGTSIFNSIGRYGGEISRLSPFNSITSTPPKIYKEDRFIGYLTVNRIKTPRIDPHALIGWLKSQE